MQRPPVPWNLLEVPTRRGLYANDLPSNRALPNDVTEESTQQGWTVQQPFVHWTSTVTLDCILCATPLDTRNWAAHRCPVQAILGGER